MDYKEKIKTAKDSLERLQTFLSDLDSCVPDESPRVDAIEGFESEFESQVSHLIASTMNREHEYTRDYVKWTADGLLEYARREIARPKTSKPHFKAGDWIINRTQKVMKS